MNNRYEENRQIWVANNSNLDRPDDTKVYTLCGIYVGCAVMAFIIIATLLDKITLDKKQQGGDGKISPELFLSTFKHWWGSTPQKLLTFLTIYSGIEQAFITGDYTKSYISCAIGIWNVGYVMICYGVVDAICSFAFGRLVQFVGHAPFFLLAFLLHGGTQIALFLWQPNPDNEILFYVFAAMWGMGDAVIQTQINALYGYLFTNNTEAAFSNYRLWESLGFIMAFAWSGFLVTKVKLGLCFGFLTVGMIFYTITEILERRKKKGDFHLNENKKTPLLIVIQLAFVTRTLLFIYYDNDSQREGLEFLFNHSGFFSWAPIIAYYSAIKVSLITTTYKAKQCCQIRIVISNNDKPTVNLWDDDSSSMNKECNMIDPIQMQHDYRMLHYWVSRTFTIRITERVYDLTEEFVVRYSILCKYCLDLNMEEESMEETMQMEQLNGGNQIGPSTTSNDESSPENTEPAPMGRMRILKNVFVVSIGFMFLFTSFQSLSNLQSTLNKDEGLGTGGLSVVYGALVVSCMLLPSFVIAHLGCKWTVTLSMLCYIAYMALNFHAIWGTIIPASIIVGLGGGTLWAAKCAYLTQIAVWYC
ncbi:Hypothetical predicted protein [Mytilus galloprovincialis]|uniref:Uncharacterized protein n=1 Tax=Mytilus galloprovincialis TaxID=29158 RepID=A0A8B6GKT6_MYTGA|nr:Hypothetical predicted protein [Mytilus galloprovincialis]